MILYVNGDSHAAGAEINNSYCFADDDPIIHNNKDPHPKNIINSFGYQLAKKLNHDFVTDARSGASNERILRTTEEFLKNNQNVFVLIGWSSFDRTEVDIDGDCYQFSPGFNSKEHSKKVQQYYKNYIDNVDIKKNMYCWHKKIVNLKRKLDKNNISYLFFNTYQVLDVDERIDWQNRYIGAYDTKKSYWHWLHDRGYSTVNNGYHYGADAHKRWANRLYNWLTHHQLL
jgi:hypothetical protein